MNLLREKIGIMIREKRNSQHLTQEDLAEKVNLSTGMIGQIERGETMPSIESLDAIIKELGIDPRSLFGDTPQSNKELAELYMIVSRMSLNQQHLLLRIDKAIRDDRRWGFDTFGTNNKNTTLNGLLKSGKIDLDTIHFKVVFLWKSFDWEFAMMKHRIWLKS